jgi:O-antigen/teichoic acid export membrane protein
MYHIISLARKKYAEMSESVKCSLFYVFCNLFQKGIAFITVPIFTKTMSTEEYGQFGVFQSWNQILLILTSWNIAYGVLNKALTKYKQHEEYISSIQTLYTIVTVLVFILYQLIKLVFGNLLNLPFSIEILMFIEMIVTPALSIYTVRNRYILKYKLAVFLTLLLAILNPGLGLLFINNSNEKGISRILSYLIAQILICLPIYIYNFKGKKLYHKDYWNYTIKFSIQLLPLFLSTIILNQADKIMISRICGDSFAGVYTISFSVAMIMKIFNESVNASFVPWMYKKIKNNKLKGIKQLTNKIVIGIAALNLMLIYFTPEVIGLISTQEYMGAIYIMPALTISVCLMFEVSLFNNIEMYYEKNNIIMISSIASAVANVLLNYIFINKYGYLAAGCTTLTCYVILLIIHMLYCKKRIANISAFINYRFMLIINMLLFVVGGIAILLYPYLIVRILLFVILGIIMLILGKQVIGGLKND